MQASGGYGDAYNGLTADWNLLKTSIGINTGLLDSENYQLSDLDLNNNPRLNLTIDLGAYEDQGVSPEFEVHPINQFKCSGDQCVFEVKVNDTVNYVWKRDGEIIINSNSSQLIINDVSISDQGNYQCFISNGYGEFSSYSAFLQVNEPPEILTNLNDSWAEKDEQTTLEIYASGTNINYQWQKDGMNIENAKSPKLIINNIGYSDEGKYRCIVSNSCDIDSSKEVSLYLAPQICLVTVSPVSGDNLIVWEKNSIAPILFYNVYRESSVAEIYDLLGSVASGDLSVYIDNEAEPTSQAYIYKVTAIDENLEETEISLCKPHKTIHLLVSTNVELNSSQLEWDNYYGFDYNSYNIYKSTTGSAFELAHTIASTHSSWTDPISSDTPVYYRISVMKPDACLPTGGSKKATEVYDNSVSNMDNNLKEQGGINHAPTDILLSNSSIPENQNIGSLIGRFSTIDEDQDDVHSYKLSPGTGDEDNYSFTIISDLLLSAESFNYENKNSYSIRIKAIDNGEDRLSIEKVMQVDITDVLETTGIDNNHKDSDLHIYPNPFIESARLEFYNPEEKECIISISDLRGKEIRNYSTRTNFLFIERENMKSGVYIIEIKGEKIFRGRLVVL